MPSRPFRLLAYDFDGTLVDTKEDIALSVNLALEELGLPARSREEIFSFVGHGVLNLMKKAVGESGGVEAEHAVDVFRKHYRVHVLDTTLFYPNCIEVLEHFHSRIQAIVSNKPVEFVESILEGLEQRHHFASVYGGDSVANKKPDPEMVQHLLQVHAIPPEQALVIGDSPQDIEAGKRAGTATCGVTWGLRPLEDVKAAAPDYLIDNMADLKNLVA